MNIQRPRVTELFDVCGWLERRYRKSYRKTPGGSSFSSFTKIPFAEPPLGDLRFCLPVPAKPWEGVRDAGKPCPKPIQNNYVTGKTSHPLISFTFIGSFLSKKTLVWSPNFGRMSTHLPQACWRVRRIACTSMFTDLRRRRRRRKMNLRNFFQWVAHSKEITTEFHSRWYFVISPYFGLKLRARTKNVILCLTGTLNSSSFNQVMFWVYGGGFIMGDASEENYLPGPLLDTREVKGNVFKNPPKKSKICRLLLWNFFSSFTHFCTFSISLV